MALPGNISRAREMRPLTSRNCLRNRSGLPRDVQGRSLHVFPEYISSLQTPDHREQNLSVLCGTTPATSVDLGSAAASPRAQRVVWAPARSRIFRRSFPRHQVVPAEERSRWAQDCNGEVYVSGMPLRRCGRTKDTRLNSALKDAGVDGVNIPDGARAQSRMSALATAVLVEQQIGIESVLHYCCRDRNLLGMMSDLLGASALGIRNLLLITGDPPKMGPYPDATAVFDIDAIGLTNMVNKLNHGLDIGDNPIGQPTAFCIGVGVNPGAINPEEELRRFEYKVEAGAQYAITQPVFDTDQLRDFIKSVEHVRIPIIAGIWPLVSYRNA